MSIVPKPIAPGTLALHGGQKPDPTTGSRATPIYQTVSYVFEDGEHASSLFNIARAGYVYSRISNPTVAVLEERMAALDRGVGAVAASSGMAAIHLTIATLLSAGDHIVSSRSLYGGTHNLMSYTLPRFGIDTTFVDPRSPRAFADAINERTKMVFAETLSNPLLEVLDLPAVAAIAHERGLPLVVDATMTTPMLQKSLQLGADLSVHSLTKFVGGHGIALGGCVVDSGSFDWEGCGRFPTLSEDFPGFNELDLAEEFGPSAFLVVARMQGLRDFGGSLSPQNAFYLLQGLETLPLRMRRHTENADAMVDFLCAQDEIERILHPRMPEHPDQELGRRLLPQGCGAVFSFELKGGREAGIEFVRSLRLFSHLANIGDAKSLVIHPASTTHSRMSREDLDKAGISQGLVRFSVGLEEIDDLIADVKHGLSAVRRLSRKKA